MLFYQNSKNQALNPEWPQMFDAIDDNQEVQIIIQINANLEVELISGLSPAKMKL